MCDLLFIHCGIVASSTSGHPVCTIRDKVRHKILLIDFWMYFLFRTETMSHLLFKGIKYR